MRVLRSGATLSAATVAATLAGCAPVLHDADLVPARATQIANTGPSRMDSTYANAVVAIDRRDYARALELLQMARQQNAGDVRVLNAMGVVYDKLGRFDLSHRYYAEAARADPTSPIVQANIAYSHRLQEGSAGAQIASAPIIKVSPPARGATAAVGPVAQLQPSGPAAVPGRLVAVAALQQLQAEAPVKPGRVAGLSASRVGAFAPFQSPLEAVALPASLQQLQAEAPMKAGRVAGLSQPRIGSFAPFQSPLDAFAPAAPPQQLEADASVTAIRVAGLSPPRIGHLVPPQSTPVVAAVATTDEARAPAPFPTFAAVVQPAGPLQQIEVSSLLSARGVAGLSSPPTPRIAPESSFADAPNAVQTAQSTPLPQRADATTPPAPLGQIELVSLIKARAVAGLSRLAELRFEVPEWNLHLPTPIGLTTAATAKPAVLRLATPVLQPTPAGVRVAADRQPLRIVNATGRLHRAEPIRASLAGLGWSAPRWAMAEARPQTRTVIIYSPSRLVAAKALARTLPGSARLAACTNGCSGLRLVLGADAQSWKPMPRPVIRTRSRIA